MARLNASQTSADRVLLETVNHAARSSGVIEFHPLHAAQRLSRAGLVFLGCLRTPCDGGRLSRLRMRVGAGIETYPEAFPGARLSCKWFVRADGIEPPTFALSGRVRVWTVYRAQL